MDIYELREGLKFDTTQKIIEDELKAALGDNINNKVKTHPEGGRIRFVVGEEAALHINHTEPNFLRVIRTGYFVPRYVKKIVKRVWDKGLHIGHCFEDERDKTLDVLLRGGEVLPPQRIKA